MKKFLSILYVMLLPIVVHADEYDAKIDGIYYKFSGNEAIVYCYFYNNSRQNANAYSGSVVIPKSVTYSGKTYSVTSIGDLAFNGCTGLTEIIIPNSIVSIGPCAFSGCTGLKAVTIPNSVTSIREFTFQNCTGLTEVIIPNSITSIRSSVFSGCTGLKAITIPNSVTSIGECAFQNCTGLTEVIIPNSITSISSSVFSGCTGLKAITIPNSVTSIGSSAFSGCTGLKVITIPNSVTSIGSSTFSDCTKLKAVTIPNSMKSIPSKSFYNTSLTSLTIGTGVLSIETDAFKYDNGKGTNPLKVIWLTNTPPKGYDYVRGKVNYVSNTNYPSSWNVYPYLSSMFEVDGIKYVPVSPSERTCDAIDCVYNESAENINLSELVTNKGISLTVKQICPYLCYDNPVPQDLV